jgi:hypothetical protein
VKYRLAYFVILGCTGGIIFQRPFGLKARQLSNARDADSFGSRARQSHAKDCAVRIVCSHLKTPSARRLERVAARELAALQIAGLARHAKLVFGAVVIGLEIGIA